MVAEITWGCRSQRLGRSTSASVEGRRTVLVFIGSRYARRNRPLVVPDLRRPSAHRRALPPRYMFRRSVRRMLTRVKRLSTAATAEYEGLDSKALTALDRPRTSRVSYELGHQEVHEHEADRGNGQAGYLLGSVTQGPRLPPNRKCERFLTLPRFDGIRVSRKCRRPGRCRYAQAAVGSAQRRAAAA